MKLNGSKKLGVRMWNGVCICKDDKSNQIKLMVSIRGKEFTVRSELLKTGSNSVLL